MAIPIKNIGTGPGHAGTQAGVPMPLFPRCANLYLDAKPFVDCSYDARVLRGCLKGLGLGDNLRAYRTPNIGALPSGIAQKKAHAAQR
jgi:hypothetical protein